jgi:hypothetical protein
MKKHFLDDWISGLKEIRHNEIKAYLIDKWPSRETLTKVRNWTEEDISFIKAISGLNNESITERVNHLAQLFGADRLLAEAIYDKANDAIEFDYDDDIDEKLSPADKKMRRKKHSYWTKPIEIIMKGSNIKPDNSVIFTVDFTITGMLGWTWGWVARAFTPELAFVSEWDADDGFPLEFKKPFGVVTRQNLYKSIALLFLNNPVEDASKLESKKDTWDSILPKGDIDYTELYRLLLAATGMGERMILDMDHATLAKYKAPGAEVGYDDI